MSKREDIKKVLIIGSGPIIIGQACEFDYSGTQACKALKNLGYEIVLVNSNPATIMTDPEIADVTYIEPLNDCPPRFGKKDRMLYYQILEDNQVLIYAQNLPRQVFLTSIM